MICLKIIDLEIKDLEIKITIYYIRSSEVVEQEIEFDTSLLEENENLQANEIMWNNLTAESLQVM